MSSEGEQSRGLPRGWRWTKLGEIITEGPTNGHSPRSNPGAAGTLTLRLSATTPGHLVLNDATTKRLDEQVPTESPLWLRPGDLLVQRSNTAELVGTAAIYDGPPATYVYPDLLMRLRFNDPATARWVWRFLNSPTGKRQLKQLAGGSAGNMPKISGAKLVGVPIPLPPLPEQRRIAALLDKADAIRRKRQQAIRLADDLLRSAFLDMFGNAVRAAHRWTPVPLATLCSAIVDCPHSTPAYAPSRTAYPCVRTSDLQDGFLDFSTTKYVDAGEYTARIGRMAPAAGDVLYSREGERFGIAAIVPPRITPCLGQRMMLLRADEAVARPAFLWALMNSPAFYSRVAQLAGGSTSPHVNVVDIKRLPAFLPPFPLQARFERLVEQIAAIRNGIMDALPTADDLLHCLAQRAFRGDK